MSASRSALRDLVHHAGPRYWTASVLPALIGTLLPLWSDPPTFSFRWVGATEFLAATLMFHAGFSLLLARVNRAQATGRARLLTTAIALVAVGCLIGLHLNAGLRLHAGVPHYVFLVYGLAVLFTGALYVLPPLCFSRRFGGEVVLAVGLGLVPVLGAYLVQVGDLTRTVYLAAIPIVLATGTWVWADELVTRAADEAIGRSTMVELLPERISRRYGTIVLVLLCYASLGAAILVRRSLPPLALLGFASLGPAEVLVKATWSDGGIEAHGSRILRSAFLLHLALCVGIVVAAVFA